MNKRLFVDMDGTIAHFHDECDYLERMWEKDFFRSLQPFYEAIEGIKFFIKENNDIEIFILTTFINLDSINQKNQWIDEYLPEINISHRIFTDLEKPKTSFIPNGLTLHDYLFDDYNKNLIDWQNNGGTAIKCRNNINHRDKHEDLWKGNIISNQLAPKVISYELNKIINELGIKERRIIFDNTSINDMGKEIIHNTIFDNLNNSAELFKSKQAKHAKKDLNTYDLRRG